MKYNNNIILKKNILKVFSKLEFYQKVEKFPQSFQKRMSNNRFLQLRMHSVQSLKKF